MEYSNETYNNYKANYSCSYNQLDSSEDCSCHGFLINFLTAFMTNFHFEYLIIGSSNIKRMTSTRSFYGFLNKYIFTYILLKIIFHLCSN